MKEIARQGPGEKNDLEHLRYDRDDAVHQGILVEAPNEGIGPRELHGKHVSLKGRNMGELPG